MSRGAGAAADPLVALSRSFPRVLGISQPKRCGLCAGAEGAEAPNSTDAVARPS